MLLRSPSVCRTSQERDLRQALCGLESRPVKLFQDYSSTLSSSLTDVDVASVTAQMATYQTQLQASYAAISRISSPEADGLSEIDASLVSRA